MRTCLFFHLFFSILFGLHFFFFFLYHAPGISSFKYGMISLCIAQYLLNIPFILRFEVAFKNHTIKEEFLIHFPKGELCVNFKKMGEKSPPRPFPLSFLLLF